MPPSILVESPTLGASVSSPVRITGTANVFEAVFAITIVDGDGLILADEVVMATSGTGPRGTVDATITYTMAKAGTGSLIVYFNSAKDGWRGGVAEVTINP